jgi:hypothetical protein
LVAISGRKQSELIREAVDRLHAEHHPKDWRQALEGVRGMWADRNELDELYADLRAEYEYRLGRPGAPRTGNERGTSHGAHSGVSH